MTVNNSTFFYQFVKRALIIFIPRHFQCYEMSKKENKAGSSVFPSVIYKRRGLLTG